MPNSEDISLLKRYAEGDESAFPLLVERYIHLVYSTALRQVGNPSHAEEISQAVFIILTRRAKSISPKTILSGWLYQTARLTAANFLRSENSRQQREQEAYMRSTLTAQDIKSWNEIAPLLEEAMGRLGQTDRDAIVLRFFENKTPQELATIMGLNEVTARKRVSRALERLRKYFSKRGVVSTTSALAQTISSNAIQVAPVGLAKSVTNVAVAKGAAASTSTVTLVKGALKIMTWTKAKSVTAIGIGMLLVAGTATVVEKVSQSSDAVICRKLPGTWVLHSKNGGSRTIWTADGHFVAYLTGKNVMTLVGTWQVRNGFIIETWTNSAIARPGTLTHGSRVLRINSRELVVQDEGYPPSVFQKVQP